MNKKWKEENIVCVYFINILTLWLSLLLNRLLNSIIADEIKGDPSNNINS